MWGAIASVAASVISSRNKKKSAAANNAANYEQQKEFAQNGISWKVADAKRAGIHPLAALGASTTPYTPFQDSGQYADGSVYRDAADAISSISSRKRQAVEQRQADELHELSKRNIEADIALKQAEASRASRTAQAMNSQQDVTKAPEIVGPTGKWQTSKTSKASDVEDEYGGVIGELYSIGRFLNDWWENSPQSKPGYWEKQKKRNAKRTQEHYNRIREKYNIAR
jgi:hypothetical protein